MVALERRLGRGRVAARAVHERDLARVHGRRRGRRDGRAAARGEGRGRDDGLEGLELRGDAVVAERARVRALDGELDEVHVGREEARAVADVDGRLHLVPRQDPELDLRLGELGDRRRHAVLELVLDGRRADDRQVLLDERRRGDELLLARAAQGRLRRVPRLGPGLVLAVAHVPLREDERPQAVARELLEVRVEGLAPPGDPGVARRGVREAEDDVVGALGHDADLAVREPHDRRHALARAVEGDRREDRVGQGRALGPARRRERHVDDVDSARREREAEVAGALDERLLVGRLRLVARRPVLADLGDDGVADGHDGREVALDAVARDDELLERLDARLAAVDAAADGAALERHDVLRERARLVAEDVRDHAEVRVHVRRPRERGRVRRLVVHLDVFVDVKRLA